MLWLTARTLHEVSLQESIRYAPGDAVEKWLNDLLCLDCLNITRIVSGCPLPEACELYPLSHQLCGAVAVRERVWAGYSGIYLESSP